MGRPKAALPLRDRTDTFLSRIIRTLSEAGLPEIVVVTGSTAGVVRAAAGHIDRRVRFAHNSDWESGQLSSLLVGLSLPPHQAVEAALVTLVDVPLVGIDTVRKVMREWRRGGAPIVRPANGKRHGHPVMFDRALFAALAAADRAVGAKAVVRAHVDAIRNVPVEDAGAFLDMDTDEEYRDALRQLRD
jgi:molybdenum cofactor cytidylyltransferase